MPNGPQGRVASPSDVSRAIVLLKEALAIIDGLGHPDIGARLQDVIESLDEVREPSQG